MPPRQTITREMIVDAAFDMVREKGLASLSARSIAKVLHCSTQPVYSCFSTMKELSETVAEKATEYVGKTYLAPGGESENHFGRIGRGYIKMARQDPCLFDLLYLSGRITLDFENMKFPVDSDRLIAAMKQDKYFSGFEEKELIRLLKHMWIYTHGLTVLARSNPAVTDRFIHESLNEMGAIVVMHALQSKGVKKNETEPGSYLEFSGLLCTGALPDEAVHRTAVRAMPGKGVPGQVCHRLYHLHQFF